MELLKEQCIDRGYYYEFVGDIVTDENFECDFSLEVSGSLKVGSSLEVGGSLKVGEWLEVGSWLEGRIAISTHCKWGVSVSKIDIKIGCETATVDIWDVRFAGNWHKETKPDTHEYAMIKAAYQVARAYFFNTMPLIGTKTETEQ